MWYNFLMRIFLIGKSAAAAAFADYFTQNPDNIVFSTLKDTSAQWVDIAQNNISELRDFALANEMSLTVLCDSGSISGGIQKSFIEAGLSVFAPEGECLKLTDSKIWAKRFIYRNKIPTARFQFFEKVQAAIDYIRQNRFPAVIKPDAHSAIGTRICETFSAAKSAVEEFFNTGSKRILVEEYISGREFSIYAVCDGYNPVIIGDCATYQNSFAKLDADFLDREEKNTLLNNIIAPLISSLAKEAGEYTGIIGFDFIKSKDKIYLLECNSFFKDLDAQMMINSLDEDWAKILESTISGTLCSDFGSFKTSQSAFLSAEFYENGQKINICKSGRTFNEARERLIEDGADEKELTEAIKTWKYLQ